MVTCQTSVGRRGGCLLLYVRDLGHKEGDRRPTETSLAENLQPEVVGAEVCSQLPKADEG